MALMPAEWSCCKPYNDTACQSGMWLLYTMIRLLYTMIRTNSKHWYPYIRYSYACTTRCSVIVLEAAIASPLPVHRRTKYFTP